MPETSSRRYSPAEREGHRAGPQGERLTVERKRGHVLRVLPSSIVAAGAVAGDVVATAAPFTPMPKTLYGTQSGSLLVGSASALTRQTICPGRVLHGVDRLQVSAT